MGNIAVNQQQYEQAIAAIERAIALEPSNADSYTVQGSILISINAGKPAGVIYAGLAEGLSRVGRAEEALEAAEQALRLQPAIVEAH